MEIHFCDICSESVPDHDLHEGGAKRFGDRVVCKRCDEAMTRHVGPAAQSVASGSVGAAHVGEQRSGGGTIWLVASCVGVMVLLAYLSVQRVKEAEKRVAGDFALELRNVDTRIAQFERRVETLLGAKPFEAPPDPRIDDVLARIKALSSTGSSQSFDLLFERWYALEETIGATATLATNERTATDQRLAELTVELARVRADLQLLARSMLEVLEESPVNTAPPTELRREVAEGQPPWLAFVGGLSAKEDGDRWTAVEELGASGDPQAAVHVVRALGDTAMFVRMAAARVLGDLGNPVAIGPLIEALVDLEPSVREAAYYSLRTLSGKDFKFDPNADPKDRAKRVDAWRAWWKDQQPAPAPGGEAPTAGD